MLRIINLIMLFIVIILAFRLIQQRYAIRLTYIDFGREKRLHDSLEVARSRLQLEQSTYSTTIIAPNPELDHLGLVQPTKQSIMEIK